MRFTSPERRGGHSAADTERSRENSTRTYDKGCRVERLGLNVLSPRGQFVGRWRDNSSRDRKVNLFRLF